MVKLVCGRCSWLWNYKGKREYYATCPNCKSSVSIKNGKEKKVVKND